MNEQFLNHHDLLWHYGGFAFFSFVMFLPQDITIDGFKLSPFWRIVFLTSVGVMIEIADAFEINKFSITDIAHNQLGIATGFGTSKLFKPIPTVFKVMAVPVAAIIILNNVTN